MTKTEAKRALNGLASIIRYFTNDEDPEDNPVVGETEEYMATLSRLIESLPDDVP